MVPELPASPLFLPTGIKLHQLIRETEKERAKVKGGRRTKKPNSHFLTFLHLPVFDASSSFWTSHHYPPSNHLLNGSIVLGTVLARG